MLPFPKEKERGVGELEDFPTKVQEKALFYEYQEPFVETHNCHGP